MELEKVFFIVKTRELRVKGSWVLEKPIKKTPKAPVQSFRTCDW